MTQKEKPVYVRVPVPAGSRLEDLMARYDELKAKADEAAAQLDAAKDALKFELTAAAPNTTHMVASCGGVVLELAYGESWRVDAAKLKAENPFVYASYAKKSGSWTLRRAKA